MTAQDVLLYIFAGFAAFGIALVLTDWIFSFRLWWMKRKRSR